MAGARKRLHLARRIRLVRVLELYRVGRVLFLPAGDKGAVARGAGHGVQRADESSREVLRRFAALVWQEVHPAAGRAEEKGAVSSRVGVGAEIGVVLLYTW